MLIDSCGSVRAKTSPSANVSAPSERTRLADADQSGDEFTQAMKPRSSASLFVSALAGVAPTRTMSARTCARRLMSRPFRSFRRIRRHGSLQPVGHGRRVGLQEAQDIGAGDRRIRIEADCERMRVLEEALDGIGDLLLERGVVQGQKQEGQGGGELLGICPRASGPAASRARRECGRRASCRGSGASAGALPSSTPWKRRRHRRARADLGGCP